MAITSGNLVAGKAINGSGKRGDDNGRFNLKAKLALGMAILGCAGALAFGGLRATSETPSQAAAAPVAVSRAQIWTGTCRAGGSDCLPGDDDTAPALARTMPHGWTGTCRAGSGDCLPEEDLPLAGPVAASRAQIWTGTCRAGGSDCLPGDDDIALAAPRTMPHGWLGTCRAGSSDCLPDEDFPLAGPDTTVYSAGAAQPTDISTTTEFRGDFSPQP